MDCSTPGFLILHHLPELAQTHVHGVGDAIQPSWRSVIPFSSSLQSFTASGSFLMSQRFTSGGQRIGASVSAHLLFIFLIELQLIYIVALLLDV